MTPNPVLDQTHAVERASTAASPERQLDCLLHGVGIATLDDIGWIKVTGGDRVRWLNGMVTNSIQELKATEGNYSFALNAQGQIQGDLTAFVIKDALLIETGLAQVPPLMAMFDRFIIMDDVELEAISDSKERSGLLLAGPRAAEILQSILLPALDPAASLSMQQVTWRDTANVDMVAAYAPLVPRFELWTDRSTLQAIQADLIDRAGTFHGAAVDSQAVEHLRLLEGTPKYGTDILPRHLAQETAQTRALHFSKGCYLGQEIVERIRSRGNVHRTFAAFRLEGPLPAPGAVLTADGKPVGELTSVAALPLPDGLMHLALGTARREAIQRNATMQYGEMAEAGVALAIQHPVHADAIYASKA